MIPYNIYILTYRRERVRTYESLSPALRERTVLVVDDTDEERLREVYPEARMLRSAAQGKGIGAVRQWLLSLAYREGARLLCMLDDDLVFLHAHWKSHGSMANKRKMFQKANDAEMDSAFAAHGVQAMGKGVGFTTCSTPFFNNFRERWLLRRVAHSFWINVPEVARVGATFIGTPVMVDIKFTLDCVTKGLQSWSSMWFAARDVSPSASGGVNSLGNRGKKHEEAAKLLNAKWPRYVEIVERPDNKRHVSNIGTKTDIRLYLVRAYKENVCRAED